MYNVYQEIYKFAISCNPEESNFLAPEDTEKDSMIPLTERLSRRYLWTYCVIYFAIYGLFMVPQIALLFQEEKVTNILTGIIGMLIGSFLIAILHGWIIYKITLKYHKSNPTEVYRYGKLSYNEIYPKRLRRKMWLWNVFPFFYFTFAIVPIVTRIQYLFETKLPSKTVTRKYRKSKEGNPRLEQYTLTKNFVESKINNYSKDKAELLITLKSLFERRISEIFSNVQRISIILSSLSIVISIVAFMAKDPIQTLFQQNMQIFEIIIIFIMLSVVIIIFGGVIFFISQLQIQIGKSRDLLIVQDAIDVMLSEHKQNVV